MNTTFNDKIIGEYAVIAGKRILLTPKEQMIRQCEEMAHARADAFGRAYYVVENIYGKIYVTEDPGRMNILRVCRPIAKNAPAVE